MKRALTCMLLFACADPPPPRAPTTPAPADPAASPAPAAPAASADGTKAWVGVRFEPNTRRIAGVIEGSPAARAGVRAGDEVVSLDGAAIASSHDFVERVDRAQVGAPVAIGVSRAGHTVEIKLTLAQRPNMEALARSMLVDRPAPRFPQLASLAGHVVVLDFWATWCGPCQIAVEHLNDLQAKYHQQGVEVIGLSSESDAEIAEWMKLHGVAYPCARDPGDAIAGAYAVQALPTLVVIDKTGVVRAVEVGIGDIETLDTQVARLVGP